MADLVAKFNHIAKSELHAGEVVRAAVRTRARARITLASDRPTDPSQPRPAVSPQAQSGWPTSGHSERGNLIGVTSRRILITELPSMGRRNYHVSEVPLAWVVGAELDPGVDGITPVRIQLSNGSSIRLDATTNDRPGAFVAALQPPSPSPPRPPSA